MSDKFCLKWNEFQSNVSKSFSSYRDNDDFFDVTLISSDFMKFNAHRIVLSSCSDHFRGLLKQSSGPNLHLILDNVDSKDLTHLLDYVYHGEVALWQEHLDSFLEIAQRFKLQGLLLPNGDPNLHQQNQQQAVPSQRNQDQTHNVFLPDVQQRTQPKINTSIVKHEKIFLPHRTDERFMKIDEKKQLEVLLPVVSAPENVKELNSKLDESFYQEGSIYICKICGKTSGVPRNMRDHVEIHFEGLRFCCKLCSRAFGSRNNLRVHYKRKHGQTVSISQLNDSLETIEGA